MHLKSTDVFEAAFSLKLYCQTCTFYNQLFY